MLLLTLAGQLAAESEVVRELELEAASLIRDLEEAEGQYKEMTSAYRSRAQACTRLEGELQRKIEELARPALKWLRPSAASETRNSEPQSGRLQLRLN